MNELKTFANNLSQQIVGYNPNMIISDQDTNEEALLNQVFMFGDGQIKILDKISEINSRLNINLFVNEFVRLDFSSCSTKHVLKGKYSQNLS